MVWLQENQRRRRAFHRFFAARGRTFRKRGKLSKDSQGPAPPTLKPVQEEPEDFEETASNVIQTLRSFTVSHDCDRHDVEISLATDDEFPEIRDDVQEVTAEDTREDTIQSISDSLSAWEKESSGKQKRSRSKLPAMVEFLDDNNEVNTIVYDLRSRSGPRTSSSLDSISMKALDSLILNPDLMAPPSLDQSQGSRSDRDESNHGQASEYDEVSLRQQESETVQHSVQNETMSEVSALTYVSVRSTSCSESESASSYDDSWTTPVYPHVLTVRTKSEGHDFDVSQKSSSSSSDSDEEGDAKDEIVQNIVGSDASRQKDSKSVNEEELVVAQEAQKDGGREKEECLGEIHAESRGVIEGTGIDEVDPRDESESEDPEKADPLDALDDMIERTVERSSSEVSSAVYTEAFSYDETVEILFEDEDDDDYFEDYKSYGDSVATDDDESAFMPDDNNIPFVDPIEVEESELLATEDDAGTGWRLC